MEITVVEKGASLNLDIASKQPAGPHNFYFGAGWDNPNGPVDLDIVCCLLRGGKLTQQSDLVYYGNRTAPGVQLSEDNQTGDGDGDDEDIVIMTGDVPADVDSIAIGLAAYAGADLSNAPNPHFRACDGTEESSEQIADVKAGDGAAGDTVLHAFTLTRAADGWTLTNVGDFHAKGSGSECINGFAGLFK